MAGTKEKARLKLIPYITKIGERSIPSPGQLSLSRPRTKTADQSRASWWEGLGRAGQRYLGPPRIALGPMIELKILNLNFWGVRFISKDVSKRLHALIEVLAAPSASWDFVVLEEVWSDRDYRSLADSVKQNYPHSYYFYNGVIGSGVCVLSRGPIISVLCHGYSLNGYVHKIQHGDWFGGKVVGLCKIIHKGLRVNLYATHIHAEYNRESDEYLSHRIVQAYELSQFIQCTNASGDDINVVAGDFNFEPSDIGYDIVTRFAELQDSWITHRERDGEEDGNTCNTSDNVYSILEGKVDKFPRGKRIDFIMYGDVVGRTNVACKSCKTALNRIPDSEICYSDHKGVEAVLQIEYSSSSGTLTSSTPTEDILETGSKCVTVLDTAIRKLMFDKRFFLGFLAAAFISLLLTMDADYESGSTARHIMLAFRAVLVIFMVWCFWMAVIVNRIEYHSLLATKNSLLIQLEWERSGKSDARKLRESLEQ